MPCNNEITKLVFDPIDPSDEPEDIEAFDFLDPGAFAADETDVRVRIDPFFYTQVPLVSPFVRP